MLNFYTLIKIASNEKENAYQNLCVGLPLVQS